MLSSGEQADFIHIQQYRIINKIDSSNVAYTYMADNQITGQSVALKMEMPDILRPQLAWEYQVLRQLNGTVGTPRAYDYFVEHDCKIMVMELMGPTLEEHFEFCERRFSMKTVLMLAALLIDRVENVHAKGYLHRDISPSNFAMGVGQNKNRLYIMGLGISKRYLEGPNNTHIAFKCGKRIIGTVRYASINALLGLETSRRDDLEGLGYMLSYFLRGNLPWKEMRGPIQQQAEYALELKHLNNPEKLFHGFPDEFTSYLMYCRRLQFKEQPNYEGLRNSFVSLFGRLKYINDGKFDWDDIEAAKKEQREKEQREKEQQEKEQQEKEQQEKEQQEREQAEAQQMH